ncbi:MAG: DUF489 family protein [Pseudomonadota bacterium]
MRPDSMHNRVMALAGVFQSSLLAHQLLEERAVVDEEAYQASIESLYTFDAESTLAVFGGITALKAGLDSLEKNFSGRRQPSVLAAVVSLLQLGQRVIEDGETSANLADGLQATSVHRKDPGFDETRHIARLAELYTRTISPLSPRVLVRGNSSRLKREETVSAVRAVLLAGVRAAVLWRQLGGSRWQIIFRGRRVLAAARTLLDDIAQHG